MAVKLHVWGERACFTRPEFKVERVSYGVMTPSAARGILEAIYWKPTIRWHVDRIHVLKPIQFESIRRNEIGVKASAMNALKAINRGSVGDIEIVIEDHRQQRGALTLKDVAYVIEAHFTMIDSEEKEDNAAKHIATFRRRAMKGQCFHRPYLGVREFDAYFALLGKNEPLPLSMLSGENRNVDLGTMLHDIDFAHGAIAHFFHAKIRDGVITVPSFQPVA